jgi:hypothetical protein
MTTDNIGRLVMLEALPLVLIDAFVAHVRNNGLSYFSRAAYWFIKAM